MGCTLDKSTLGKNTGVKNTGSGCECGYALLAGLIATGLSRLWRNRIKPGFRKLFS